jgi:hypothetical protein
MGHVSKTASLEHELHRILCPHGTAQVVFLFSMHITHAASSSKASASGTTGRGGGRGTIASCRIASPRMWKSTRCHSFSNCSDSSRLRTRLSTSSTWTTSGLCSSSSGTRAGLRSRGFRILGLASNTSLLLIVLETIDIHVPIAIIVIKTTLKV